MSDGATLSVDTKPRAGLVVLRDAILHSHAGRIAVVSSFGAEPALLLALVAELDRSVPVLFLDTFKSFPETLAYRDHLANRLGLRDVRTITPDAAELASHDPLGDLHEFLPDDCCRIRKAVPLQRALQPFDAWVNGRKRYQTAGRSALAISETVDGKYKVNPLADWTAAEIAAEMRARALPAHPLAARGFPSIGCAPCTRAVGRGEAPRAGRWSGFAKTECGIHRAGPGASPQAVQ